VFSAENGTRSNLHRYIANEEGAFAAELKTASTRDYESQRRRYEIQPSETWRPRQRRTQIRV